jgi:hypothetical protein
MAASIVPTRGRRADRPATPARQGRDRRRGIISVADL